MSVNITHTTGYFWLDSWAIANIIELGTQSFCDRFVTYQIDPGRRLYDQMVLAARSVPANVAEGATRRNTSTETEMRLTDVGRGSLGELMGDYLNYLLYHCSGMAKLSKASINRIIENSSLSNISNNSALPNKVWSKTSPEYKAVMSLRLDAPNYSDDLMHDVAAHILRQKAKFDRWIENDDPAVCANTLMFLCFRLMNILKHQLQKQLDTFKETGGFTENMTESRLQAKREQNQQQGVPNCPICGAVMIKRMARKGIRAGQEFWSCSNWKTTGCQGTRPITR